MESRSRSDDGELRRYAVGMWWRKQPCVAAHRRCGTCLIGIGTDRSISTSHPGFIAGSGISPRGECAGCF